MRFKDFFQQYILESVDLDKTYLMFSNFIKWRKENDVENIEVKMLFSSTGQFLSKSAAIFAIFDVFSPELQYI
jgi:hypothetical protein